LKQKFIKKNLTLIKEYDKNIPDVLIGDPVRLHQIILNLLSNAVKFTATGKITVSVQLQKKNQEKVFIEFSVSDTGIGISKNKIEHIFENFQQASSDTSRIYGGTGLGLAIVKQLVEAQKGSIRVSSILGKGSVFSFTLGFQTTTKEAEIEAGAVELTPAFKKIKVLVVEDIVLNQLLMKTLLDDFGFERDIAGNGRIAIEKLTLNEYDIILMDLQMPEMNGFETTEYIRNIMKSDIPIIALSADVTTVDLAKCKAVGMNDYLAKPIDERLLYAKLVGFVKQPLSLKKQEVEKGNITRGQLPASIDLTYLNRLTKSNPALMMEMISTYLDQTPVLIRSIKKGLQEHDWDMLYASAHKLLPSFSIVGMSYHFENLTKQIQEFALSRKNTSLAETALYENDEEEVKQA
jgi:CheY-like chemotaxis protein